MKNKFFFPVCCPQQGQPPPPFGLRELAASLWAPTAWQGPSCPHRNALPPPERRHGGDGLPLTALPPTGLLGRSWELAWSRSCAFWKNFSWPLPSWWKTY